MIRKIIFMSALSLMAMGCAQKQKSGELISAKKEVQVQKETSPEHFYTCKVNKDTRVIELDKEQGRCEVHYTKFGEKSQVAWAESTPSICTEVFGKIRENIEAKGFKCESQTAKVDKAHRDAASLQ